MDVLGVTSYPWLSRRFAFDPSSNVGSIAICRFTELFMREMRKGGMKGNELEEEKSSK